MTAYTQDKEVPLGGYVTLMMAYSAVFGGLHYLTKRDARRPTPAEFLLLAVGSYKLSRIVTMSFIGSPVRAPFTTRGESRKGGEVQDEARGEGLQRAIGNMVTCPFCFNVWSATLARFAFAKFPELTLNAAQILTMSAVGDVMHLGYRTIRENAP